ncbi:MAG: hypothetical protein ACLR4Z_08055 [Butyricicoccaceae bacterium]
MKLLQRICLFAAIPVILALCVCRTPLRLAAHRLTRCSEQSRIHTKPVMRPSRSAGPAFRRAAAILSAARLDARR